MFLIQTWSFQTCSNFFSANKIKQGQSLTNKNVMIQNKCASQFFKIQNSTFPKIDTNDRLYLRHSYLFILQSRNITTIYTTEVSSKSSSQVIRYTVYCFHSVIAATSHYTEKKPPLFSNRPVIEVDSNTKKIHK